MRKKPRSRRSTEVSQQTFVPQTKGMETISDSPAGSTELFATCQLGNHLLTARGDCAVCGTQGEGGSAVTPVGSSPSAPPCPLPQGELLCLKHQKSPWICLWACWIIFCCLFVWERGGVFLFLASFPKKKSRLFFFP